jgi:tetratricopeptide (TPR) repeat protein
MKHIVALFKKDPLLASVGILAGTCLLWFLLAPQGFKTIWSKNPLVAEIIKEHDLVNEKAKVVAISYYYPTFSYFANIVFGSAQPEKELMESYYLGKPYIFHTYYQKAVDLFPDNDAAQYLLGYCEYYMGNAGIAAGHYEQSVDVNPYFFWSYYNLGVIYFQQGDFLKSAMILSKSLALRNEITLEILHQGPFYRQIWRLISGPPQILANNLRQGQADAALLLTACFVKAGAYNQALQIIQSFGPSIPWHQDLWQALRKKALSRQSATDDIDDSIQEQIPVRLF